LKTSAQRHRHACELSISPHDGTHKAFGALLAGESDMDKQDKEAAISLAIVGLIFAIVMAVPVYCLVTNSYVTAP
jgi:hypothetical protein